MTDSKSSVVIPGALYAFARIFAATSGFWRWLGNIESRVLREEISAISIERPIYVTSLARAGTTIVTEMLEHHPEVTAHHYSDFPNVWTPYWRNYLLKRTRRLPAPLSERAHKDRIQINQDSPEAVEEVLWMAYFNNLHEDRANNVVDAGAVNRDFEGFYRDHLRKLLAVRGASRYLAKGNYNISRLAYLQRLFPDARFLIPIRDPVHHIASLVKQHKLFSEAHARDKRVGKLLAMAGHFEFGPFRNAINLGDHQAIEAIRNAWAEGREVEGWARYWASVYEFLVKQTQAQPSLAEACLVFSYEDLCTHSTALIDEILAHCGLAVDGFESIRAEYGDKLSLPEYYEPSFTRQELDTITQFCQSTHERLQPLIVQL